MKSLHLSLVLCCLATLVACGGMNKDASNKDARKTGDGVNAASGEATPRAEKVGLPIAGIIRVPVDLDGKELVEQADFRTVVADRHATEATAVSAAFDGGKAPTSVKDELDSDSSTESWGSWGGSSCGGYGNSYGGGYGNSYGNYGNYDYGNYSGYGYSNSYYYNSWRPSCNYYGSSYNYGSPSYYNCGGYNYYYYPNSYY